MSILNEAEEIINGDRAAAYGPAKESFTKVANGWELILGSTVTPEQVGMCMIWLKMCRQSNKHGRDNLVDIAGYTALIEKLIMDNGTAKVDEMETLESVIKRTMPFDTRYVNVKDGWTTGLVQNFPFISTNPSVDGKYKADCFYRGKSYNFYSDTPVKWVEKCSIEFA